MPEDDIQPLQDARTMTDSVFKQALADIKAGSMRKRLREDSEAAFARISAKFATKKE